MFCFHGRGTWVVFPFILAALDNVDVVPLGEFYLDFVLKVMVQVGSEWEGDSRLPATRMSPERR